LPRNRHERVDFFRRRPRRRQTHVATANFASPDQPHYQNSLTPHQEGQPEAQARRTSLPSQRPRRPSLIESRPAARYRAPSPRARGHRAIASRHRSMKVTERGHDRQPRWPSADARAHTSDAQDGNAEPRCEPADPQASGGDARCGCGDTRARCRQPRWSSRHPRGSNWECQRAPSGSRETIGPKLDSGELSEQTRIDAAFEQIRPTPHRIVGGRARRAIGPACSAPIACRASVHVTALLCCRSLLPRAARA
jgi:hypothetical protein